ncbi:hypothetical protein SAMN05216420_10326 [Nitrosospira sp. Nl5]|uniref:hypothetical protein n=1 Tax=Nitrosospira sp. Nl5 TaxID=200120 RepID=UPI0008812B1B|nr:hypothetical protein [Nitrosospira sp. Nl5]SCY16114.1 hypothetical protein SAMN05216420_10326 [Nitrosospira sp. Nl5]
MKWAVFGVQGKAQRRGMRLRRAEQCLPQEGATPKWDAGTPECEGGRGIPTLPDPRFAVPLMPRFGAPFHSKTLRTTQPCAAKTVQFAP